MIRKAYLIAAVVLLGTFGVVGGSVDIVSTAEASSDAHSHGFSLAGRSFRIHGTYVEWNPLAGPTPPDFENCYTFVDDNVQTWLDPLFPDAANPVPGTWIQHTGGLITRYTAFSVSPPPSVSPELGVLLMQNGIVTPTFRRGKYRLNAYSTVYLGFGAILGVVLSTGHSVDSCD